VNNLHELVFWEVVLQDLSLC